MQSQCDQQLLFENLVDRTVVVKPVEQFFTCDAGLLPIREFDQNWKFTERLAECLEDPRSSCDHSFEEMLRQRLFGILADYEDCNDHSDLRHDPVFKIVTERLPNDDPLASQPTLSRFENSITPSMLLKLQAMLVTTLPRRHRSQPDRDVVERGAMRWCRGVSSGLMGGRALTIVITGSITRPTTLAPFFLPA